MPVSVRFAPSPTGLLHLGNIRLALVNWLFARKEHGKFYLRLDDTDIERSSEEFAQAIQDDLRWLDLRWSDMIRQSEQVHRYQQAIAILRASRRLYPCYESPQELALKRKHLLTQGLPPIYDRAALRLSDEERTHFDRLDRRPHWRFLLEPGAVVWNDLVRGATLFLGQELSDPVLVREDGRVLYALSSVVDDCQLGITHVIRGADHVTNTAVQIQIWRALGSEIPSFAHLPLLSDQRGQELSKRGGSLGIKALRERGIENMAINSFLARVGTSEAIKPAISLDELAQDFDWSKFSRAAARMNLDELERLNTRIVRMLPLEEIRERMAELEIGISLQATGTAKVSSSQASLSQVGSGQRESTQEIDDSELGNLRDLTRVDDAFWEAVRPNIERFQDLTAWWQIAWAEVTPVIVDRIVVDLAAQLLPPEPWDGQTWSLWIDRLKEQSPARGRGLFLPLRLALTGQEHGPELRKLLQLIGRKRALARLLGQTA